MPLSLCLVSVGDCTRISYIRQQVRYVYGPEGIRTPDLLSAIEARSQLRYRPDNESIVSDAEMTVKQKQFY